MWHLDAYLGELAMAGRSPLTVRLRRVHTAWEAKAAAVDAAFGGGVA